MSCSLRLQTKVVAATGESPGNSGRKATCPGSSKAPESMEMLLYPATSGMADLHVQRTEFPFHACHPTLAEPWEEIETRLAGLLA